MLFLFWRGDIYVGAYMYELSLQLGIKWLHIIILPFYHILFGWCWEKLLFYLAGKSRERITLCLFLTDLPNSINAEQIPFQQQYKASTCFPYKGKKATCSYSICSFSAKYLRDPKYCVMVLWSAEMYAIN